MAPRRHGPETLDGSFVDGASLGNGPRTPLFPTPRLSPFGKHGRGRRTCRLALSPQERGLKIKKAPGELTDRSRRTKVAFHNLILAFEDTEQSSLTRPKNLELILSGHSSQKPVFSSPTAALQLACHKCEPRANTALRFARVHRHHKPSRVALWQIICTNAAAFIE